jgi:uncharacterized membrane protein YpjA
MKKYLKGILFGFLTWVIPFLVSFLFYTKQGTLIIDVRFFKSIMFAVGSITAAFLLVSYFKKIKKDYFREGIIIGIIWFVMNIVLDLLVLVPMSGMPISDYFTQIGLEYIVIPVISIMAGLLLANKKFSN